MLIINDVKKEVQREVHKNIICSACLTFNEAAFPVKLKFGSERGKC